MIQLISGLQLLVSALFMLAISSRAGTAEVQEALKSAWVAANAAPLFFFLGIVVLVLAVSSLWLARGYIKGYDWARRRGRLVAALSIIFAVFGVFLLPTRTDAGSPWWSIIFNSGIILYLGRPRTIAWFKK